MTKNWQDDTEFVTYIEDLLAREEVQLLEKFVHHKVTNRLAHSISVAYRSYRWAKRLGLNKRAVARAGLLHDLFFYEGVDKHLVGGRGHNYEHPRIALKNAEKLTELSDLERDIILKHMFGATLDIPCYAESWIVTLMDKQSAISELTYGVKQIFGDWAYMYIQVINNEIQPILSKEEMIAKPIIRQHL